MSEFDLRDRFAALRREEEQGAPPFAAFRQAARTHRPASRRWLLAPAAVAAALCLVLVWPTGRTATPPPAPPGASLALADWRPPTDFLLQTPGREILTAPDWLERGFTAEVPVWGLPPMTSQKERRDRS